MMTNSILTLVHALIDKISDCRRKGNHSWREFNSVPPGSVSHKLYCFSVVLNFELLSSTWLLPKDEGNDKTVAYLANFFQESYCACGRTFDRKYFAGQH